MERYRIEKLTEATGRERERKGEKMENDGETGMAGANSKKTRNI